VVACLVYTLLGVSEECMVIQMPDSLNINSEADGVTPPEDRPRHPCFHHRHVTMLGGKYPNWVSSCSRQYGAETS
jgi:hypothetical protein